jgi:hypothetical protein
MRYAGITAPGISGLLAAGLLLSATAAVVSAPMQMSDSMDAAGVDPAGTDASGAAGCRYSIDIMSESSNAVEPGGTLRRHVQLSIRPAKPAADEGPVDGSGIRISFGQGRLGTLRPEVIVLGKLHPTGSDGAAVWEGSLEVSYQAGPSAGFDFVPYTIAGIRESPCENVNPVSALPFAIVGEYRLSMRGEHKGLHGVAESTWQGFFSITPGGDVEGGGFIVHGFKGRCVQFETSEVFRIGRDAGNLGDERRLVLTIGDVTTIADHMEQDLEDLSCLFGSMKEVGEATLLASTTVLKNLGAAGKSGEGFLTFSLPITGSQGKEDATGHWVAVIEPSH